MNQTLLTLAAGLLVFSGSTRSDDSVKGKFWVSPDRSQVLVSFPQSAAPEAYYFHNNKDRLCYTFMITGKWLPGQESGLLVSKDGQAFVGVALYSTSELAAFEGVDLVTRAARHITAIYEQEFGKQVSEVKITPFESSKQGAIKWSASWVEWKPGITMGASKVFIELAPGWVAQVSVGGTGDDEGLMRQVVATLSSTSEAECYWPFIRQHFPFVR